MPKKPPQTTNLIIRNSTAEFLMFTADTRADGIEVRYENETVWLSQKMMAELFEVDRSVITKHLKNIFDTGELDENSICAKIALTQPSGNSQEFKNSTTEESSTTHNSSFTIYH